MSKLPLIHVKTSFVLLRFFVDPWIYGHNIRLHVLSLFLIPHYEISIGLAYSSVVMSVQGISCDIHEIPYAAHTFVTPE